MTDERQDPIIPTEMRTDKSRATSNAPDAPVDDKNPYPEAFDEDLFLLYVGPRSDKFLRLYRARKQHKTPLTFNWVVFFTGLPWFFYRKLYFIGVCVLLIPVVLILVFPGLAAVSTVGVGATLALTANWLYVWVARRRVAALKALDLPPDELRERARAAGGTSVAGAVFGAVIVIAIVSLPFIETATAKLPGCEDARVQEIAAEIVTGQFVRMGGKTADIRIGGFAPAGTSADGGRTICEFSVTTAADTQTGYLSISWKRRLSAQYQVRVGSTRNAVLR